MDHTAGQHDDPCDHFALPSDTPGNFPYHPADYVDQPVGFLDHPYDSKYHHGDYPDRVEYFSELYVISQLEKGVIKFPI